MLNKYNQLIIGLLLGIILGFGLGNYFTKSKASPLTNENHLEKSYPKNKQVNSNEPSSSTNYREGPIPQKAYTVWQYVQENGKPMNGYVGGREFKNREGQLESKNKEGKKIKYQEWDVNPQIENRNRGAERLVTSDEARAFYTNDHYKSFQELKK